jgi:hypothetical protein
MAKIYSQLEKAQMENVTSDTASEPKGMMKYRTDLNQAKVSDGTTYKALIDEDSNQTLSNKNINNPTIEGFEMLSEITTPSNPTAGYNKLYFKNDGNLYKLNSAGTEVQFSAASFTSPTVQKFTGGSGTYTKPANVLYITVEMCGGGGGGGSTGLGGTTGGTGGTTTFGTSLLTATGGLGGVSNVSTGYGGVGGSVTVNSPAISLVQIAGAPGSDANHPNGTAAFGKGGDGGSTAFGGRAAGGLNRTPVAAIANSGSGGGGGGNVSTGNGAGGGGAGGYIKALIQSPAASYSYSVGIAGVGSTAGANSDGSNGGSGVIIVTEYYQ